MEQEIIEMLKVYKTVNYVETNEDGTVVLKIKRYYSNKNTITASQNNFIRYYNNIKYSVSINNVLRHLSKYSASALISLAKTYPNTLFYVII